MYDFLHIFVIKNTDKGAAHILDYYLYYYERIFIQDKIHK